MADPAARLICPAPALQNGGKGVRFEVDDYGKTVQAFVIRHDGVVYGYLNRCRHLPVELDWQDGRFFDSSGRYLMCAMHGAVYQPESGLCVSGPCHGQSLLPLQVAERDGGIYHLAAAAQDTPAANV